MDPIRNGDGQSGSRDGVVNVLATRLGRLEALVEILLRDVAELKADLKDLRKQVDSNFRLLAAMNITTAVGLAAVMAKGFGWI